MEPEKSQAMNLAADVEQRGLCEQLAGDHRRLPMLLSQAEWRVQQKLFPGAERCFAEFCSCLEKHLAEEERVESAVFGDTGEVAPRRTASRAHGETLRRMLSAAGEAIEARDCEWFASSASDLCEALAAYADAEKKLFALVEQLSRSSNLDPGLSEGQASQA